MSKKIKPSDNASNQKNKNKGTSGSNRQNSQVHGNRSKQLEADRKLKGKKSK